MIVVFLWEQECLCQLREAQWGAVISGWGVSEGAIISGWGASEGVECH